MNLLCEDKVETKGSQGLEVAPEKWENGKAKIIMKRCLQVHHQSLENRQTMV